jgi:hypothetical protein
MNRSFATQFRKLLQQLILFILTLNFLFIGTLSYAVDLTDKEPPTLESIKIVSSGSSISDLYVLEIVLKDDKNWVSFQDKSFYFSYKDDLPVCSVNYGNIFYSTDEVSRETNPNGAKIQKFYLSFAVPRLSLPNCPKFSVSKFEFSDRISLPTAFISIRDEAGRVSKIPIISKVLESPLILNKDFFQRFTMSNFGVWLCVGDLSGTPLTSKDRQNATNDLIKSYNQFLSLLDSYTQISGNSDLMFSRKIFDQWSNQEYAITWDLSKMRQELIQRLDDNLRLRDFQNSKSLTDLLKLRVCAPVSEKEWLDARMSDFMTYYWFQLGSGFVDEVTTQIRKAEAKAIADKAAAEPKAKQDAEAKAAADKAAAELKAKQEAELKAKQEAELKAKQEAELKAKQEAELKAKQEAELKAKQEAELKTAAELKAKQESEVKVAATKKTTITCLKGKLVKKVTGVKPVCPKGYKKK